VRINYYIALAYDGLNEKKVTAGYFNQVAYLSGLSYLGERNDNAANENFRKSVELDQTQVWPKIMLHLKIKL